MARPKKPTTKKTTSTRGRRPATKATPKKARTSAKSAAKATSGDAIIKLLKGVPSTKRPPNNPDVPQEVITFLNHELSELKDILDGYAQHLRSLDRKRLNGVGIKKMGFIERAYELALENGEFLPHYLTLDKFGEDIEYFMDFRSITDLANQIREQLWNITIQSADIAYTDALEFYSSVREAAKRRVDAAETLFTALSPFFKRHRAETEEPTEKKALRDFKALEHGKHDGKLVIENIRPKMVGGKRKIIDETFKDTAEFKESVDGEITE